MLFSSSLVFVDIFLGKYWSKPRHHYLTDWISDWPISELLNKSLLFGLINVTQLNNQYPMQFKLVKTIILTVSYQGN